VFLLTANINGVLHHPSTARHMRLTDASTDLHRHPTACKTIGSQIQAHSCTPGTVNRACARSSLVDDGQDVRSAETVRGCRTTRCQLIVLPLPIKMNDIPTVQTSAHTTAYTMPSTLSNDQPTSPSSFTESSLHPKPSYRTDPSTNQRQPHPP